MPTRSRRRSRASVLRAIAAPSLLLTLLLSAPACFALTPEANLIASLRHQAWSTEEGLPQSSVHRILQTRDGFLWIATEAGLARFDGVSFQVFGRRTDPAFLSDDISSLAEDSSGALWIGTADGLLRLQAGRFQRFATEDGLPSSSISALSAAADGALLVLTLAGPAQWDRARFLPLPAALPRVLALQPAKNGGTWLITEDGIFVLRKGAIERSQAVPSKYLAGLLGIAEGSDTCLWLRSSTLVTALSCGPTRVWSVGRELPGARVESLTVDRAGTAWVGTNAGLAALSASAAAVSPIPVSRHPVSPLPVSPIPALPIPALAGNSVLDTFEDTEGDLWIGSEASGLHVLRQLNFRSQPGLEDQPLTAVVEAGEGAIWVGTRDAGLRRVPPTSAPTSATADEPIPSARLLSPIILSLAPGVASSVWVGTPDGLDHVQQDGKVQPITSMTGLPDDFIRTLLSDPDGSVWAGTRRGLAHVQAVQVAHGMQAAQAYQVTVLTRADGLGSDLIGPLLRTSPGAGDAAAPAALWVGTSGGLSRLTPDGAVHTYSTQDGLPGPIVSALAADRTGVLWVATQGGGLSRLHGTVFQPVRALPAATENDRQISALAADAQGFLWLRAAREVQRISLASLNRCADPTGTCALEVTRYGLADGLPSEEIVPGASPLLWQTKAGDLLFSTRRGLAIVNADHVLFNHIPPPVVLERFLVDDRAVPLSTAQNRPLDLPYTHARYIMEYAGLSFALPSKVRYRYRLEGFDRDWTDAGARRSATYTNLAPGTYRFRVLARNNDGVWNETGAELSFRIVPPFYRRWWFALAVLAFVAALIYALLRLRVRRLRTQFDAVLAERNRMAREIHDTLAQDFVGVSIQLDIVAQLLAQTKIQAALDQVGRTRTLVTEGLAEARRSIWELRANTSEDSLPSRLRQIVERYTRAGTAMNLRIGGAFRTLPPQTENEILRIAQEALSNIDRHAHASSASVTLQYGNDMLVLTIADDGRGFSIDREPGGHLEANGHFGVQGMRERAAVIGSRLQLVSEPGQGTRIVLSTPIAAAER